MEFLATCPMGFERYLSDELARLGCTQLRPLKGQVSFGGELADAYTACLWSRLASRVIVVLTRIDAHDSDALYEGLRTIAWEDVLRPGASVAVDAHGTNAELRNSRFVEQRSKDAIVDSILAARGTRPQVNALAPDLTVSVRISRDRAMVGLDLSGEPLFRRGYDLAPGRRAPIAPLRPDYAAALLMAGGWDKVCEAALAEGRAPRLLAVYPGAGSVLAEAAGMAADRAPGLSRARWGFAGWSGHDASAWELLVAEAEAQCADTASVELLAFDARRASEGSCRQMLRASGSDAAPRFVSSCEQADLVVCDLSWVSADNVAEEADALAKASALLRPTYGAPLVALAHDPVVDAVAGREPAQTTGMIVGHDEVTLRVYQPAESMPEAKTVSLASGSQEVFLAQSEQFASRLSKVFKQRAKWARREDVSCYRIYDADLPDYAVTLDLFEESLETAGERPRKWLQVFEYAPPKDVDPSLARMRLLDALAIAQGVLGIDPRDVFVRTRRRAKGGSQYADEAAADKGKRRSRMVAGAELVSGAHLVDEGGLVFEVNFSTRLDCGIFLDHRDTRAQLREMAKKTAGSKRFLNLFAYTGTATCYAADGGMKHTTTVDMSRPSLDWAKRNMVRNGFSGPEHEFVQADVVRWVGEQRRTKNRWDLVFCDVPTFSNSQRMRKGSFDVQRDHVELLIGVSRLLTRGRDGNEGGVCVFSCNLRTFKPDVAALAKAGVTIEDVTQKTIPEDFARNQKVHHCYLVRRA